MPQHHRTFGRHTQPHTVIIARGDRVRHFTIRPSMLALSTAIVSALVAGSVGIGAYLVMRDDILSSGTTTETRLQRAYEDRIASLRTQLDRAVSRQLLDRETVETKVDTLIGQQAELAARYDRLRPLFEQARSNGLLPRPVPVPQPKPAEHAEDEASSARPDVRALAFADDKASEKLGRFGLIDRSEPGLTLPLRTARAAGDATIAGSEVPHDLIREIGQAIDTVEDRQIADLETLAEGARRKASGIATALRSEGIALPVEEPTARGGEGGPFVEAPASGPFDISFAQLEDALTDLQLIKDRARQLPLAEPVGDAAVSSTFGVRADPFLGRSALHTGIDFVASSGTTVAATAAGTVVAAGPNGGYGNMVEVDHGGGVMTRYAHMSSIRVSVGGVLRSGDVVGEVGSTGRSTGPHLHYEIRRDGNAVDPSRFLRAGRKINALG